MTTSFRRLQGDPSGIRAARDGARAMAPWLVGVAPLGFVIGVTTARADIPACAGWLAGPLIFSASAQAVTIELLNSHAAVPVVIAAGLVVNVRLVLYSAAMARALAGATGMVEGAGRVHAGRSVGRGRARRLRAVRRPCVRPRALRRRRRPRWRSPGWRRSRSARRSAPRCLVGCGSSS